MMNSSVLLLLTALSAVIADTSRIGVYPTFRPSARETTGEVLAVSETGKISTSSWQNGGHYQLAASAAPADLFFNQGLGTDTLYVGSVAAQDTAVYVRFPLALRKNLFGHYVCPKCRKADATVKIVNSDAPLGRMIITPTDTSYLNIVGRKKYESFINGGGRSYCQRDKILF